MYRINLADDVIKMLGIYFSYNKNLEHKNNFLNYILKTQNILNYRN